MLRSVPFKQRPLSSLLSVFFYNLLGWAAGPVVSSAIMEFYNDYAMGYKISLAFAILPCIFTTVAYSRSVQLQNKEREWFSDPLLGVSEADEELQTTY